MKNANPPKNPSNREILLELRAFREDYNGTVPLLKKDVTNLMSWKRDLEITEKAVDTYKRKEAQTQSDGQKKRYYQSKTELVRDLAPAIVTVLGIVYLILGKH